MSATTTDRPTSAAPATRTALAVLALAVLVCLPAGALSGAFTLAPEAIGDPGALTRWGLPVLRVVHDITWCITVGLLLVGGTLLPDDKSGTRRIASARLAAPFAGVWAASAVLGVVLTFSDLSGLAPTTSAFTSAFSSTATSFDSLKAMIAVAVLAVAATIGTATAHTRSSVVWTLALALVATFPASLAGHASGSSGHDTAVTSLLFHLLGVLVWTGGLLALVVLRPVVGARDLVPAVRRYSALALWCFVLVALSGVLNAAIRVGSFSALSSHYGWLVVAKTLALVVLGVFGWRQRTVLVGKIADGVAGAFTRLAVLELAIMGAAVGLAVALSRSAPPVPEKAPNPTIAENLTGYPAPPAPSAAAWITTWRVDWLWLTLSVIAAVLYLKGVATLRKRGDRWPIGRTICWFVGLGLFLATTQGAMGVYGRVMFSWHMLMHMHLSMAIPMFLVLAAPSTLVLRAVPARRDGSDGAREILLRMLHSRWIGFMSNPVVAGINFFASLIVFYYSGLFEASLRTHTGHVLMVVHFVLAGYAFAWVLIGIDPGPKKWPAPMRLLLLLVTLGFHAWFGIALMSGSELLAPTFFETLKLPYVPSLIEDQQTGGGIAWGIGEFPTLVLALLVGLDWVRSDKRETNQYDRAAARDHDAELKAYNERLAKIAERDAGVR